MDFGLGQAGGQQAFDVPTTDASGIARQGQRVVEHRPESRRSLGSVGVGDDAASDVCGIV